MRNTIAFAFDIIFLFFLVFTRTSFRALVKYIFECILDVHVDESVCKRDKTDGERHMN